MTGFDAGETDDEVAAPARAGGADRRIFMEACALGLNPAIAYLTIARGAGNRPVSAWSVDAIERYTGMTRPKAKLAVKTLVDGGIITLERSGTRPLYGMSTASNDPLRVWLPSGRTIVSTLCRSGLLIQMANRRCWGIRLSRARTSGWILNKPPA